MPPKDQNYKYSIMWNDTNTGDIYNLMTYYSVQMLYGNDIYPITLTDISLATIMIFIALMFMGTRYGDITNLLTEMNKKEETKNIEFDMMNLVMKNLRIPEKV